MAFDYSASFGGINNAISNIGKQNELAYQRQTLAKLGQQIQSGDYAGAAQAAFSAGDAGTGIGLLKLGQAEKERQAIQSGISAWSSGASPSATGATSTSIGTPNDVENSFVGAVKNAGLTNPVGLGAVAAYGKAESGYNPGNVNRSWSDPSQSGQPGTAGGIMSWRADRLQNLQRFAASRGEQGNGSPVTQALFLAQENPQLIPALQAAKSPEEANQIMANAWRFAGYNQPGGENARRLALTQGYAQRFGGQAGPAPAVPVQFAANEAEVQRLEAQQGNPVVDAPAPVQVAPAAPQAGSPMADVPAAGAVPTEGFAVPGGEANDSIASDPQVQLWRQRLNSPLAVQSPAARAIAERNLDLATKDAERRLGQTEAVKNYRFYRQQEMQAGREPMNFQQFRESTAARTNVNMPPAEKEYDKQSAKDFAELNRDVAKRGASANSKIATLNRLETLLSNPNVRTGAGAQAALTMARAAKSIFGIDTDGLGPAEAINAIANGFALELRNPSGGAGMPGALSDKDREFLMSLTPGLERTPEGNKLIIDYMKRLAGRDIEIERLRRDYIKSNKRLDDGFYEKLADFSEKNPLFPEAKAAPQKQTQAPQSGHVEDGYRFKGGNPADPSAWEKVQ